MTNRDVIRLNLACETMQLEARKSIFLTALNAFGKEGVNTNQYVIYFVLVYFLLEHAVPLRLFNLRI